MSENKQNENEKNEKQEKGGGAVIDMSFGPGSPPRDTKTGAPIDPTVQFQKATVAVEEFRRIAEENGQLDVVAKLDGKSYNPTGMEVVKSSLKKSKAAIITLGWALLPGGVLALLWEGMRFVIPATRKWPGFVKYENRMKEVPVRISTPRAP